MTRLFPSLFFVFMINLTLISQGLSVHGTPDTEEPPVRPTLKPGVGNEEEGWTFVDEHYGNSSAEQAKMGGPSEGDRGSIGSLEFDRDEEGTDPDARSVLQQKNAMIEALEKELARVRGASNQGGTNAVGVQVQSLQQEIEKLKGVLAVYQSRPPAPPPFINGGGMLPPNFNAPWQQGPMPPSSAPAPGYGPPMQRPPLHPMGMPPSVPHHMVFPCPPNGPIPQQMLGNDSGGPKVVSRDSQGKTYYSDGTMFDGWTLHYPRPPVGPYNG